jgi:hypothetical protein
MTTRTRIECETVIRYDRTSEPVFLWTADALQARRWRKKRYQVTVNAGGWATRVPKGCISYRALRLSQNGDSESCDLGALGGSSTKEEAEHAKGARNQSGAFGCSPVRVCALSRPQVSGLTVQGMGDRAGRNSDSFNPLLAGDHHDDEGTTDDGLYLTRVSAYPDSARALRGQR